jgi:hypothetical protein
LRFKILCKYDDWSFRFHHFLENGLFYREKCSPFVTQWQISLHFHCCFNNKYTPYFLGYWNDVHREDRKRINLTAIIKIYSIHWTEN